MKGLPLGLKIKFINQQILFPQALCFLNNCYNCSVVHPLWFQTPDVAAEEMCRRVKGGPRSAGPCLQVAEAEHGAYLWSEGFANWSQVGFSSWNQAVIVIKV